jgi:hypothetical protein
MSKKCRKALPYSLQTDSYPAKAFASWLRNTFAPLLAKRLPTVLYSGFKHGFITSFIQKHKKIHPATARLYRVAITNINNKILYNVGFVLIYNAISIFTK